MFNDYMWGKKKDNFIFFPIGFKSALNPTQQPHRTIYPSAGIKNKWNKTSICLHVSSLHTFTMEQVIKALVWVGGQSQASAALSLRKKNRTYCTGTWMGLREDLDVYWKSYLHRD